MTPERAALVRRAAAAARDTLRAQMLEGSRGWRVDDAAPVVAALAALEASLAGAPPPAVGASVEGSRPGPPATSAPEIVAPSAPVAAPQDASPVAAPGPQPTSATAPPGAPRAAPAEVRVAADSPGPAHDRDTSPRPAPRASAAPAHMPAAPWEAIVEAPTFDLARLHATGREGLDETRAVLGDCRRCGLCATRTNIVFGVGNPSARLVFVGEGPGADEDASGEPFVGRAGELLTRMIGAMGLRRDDVYIANVVKCRPPGNREPHPDEALRCMPFLRAQLAAIAPEVVVTLGRSALVHLGGKPVTMRAARGRWLRVDEIDVMPTFHPAYILRLRGDELQQARRDAWTDLQQVMDRLGLPRPERRNG